MSNGINVSFNEAQAYNRFYLQKMRRAVMYANLIAQRAEKTAENIDKLLSDFITEDKRIKEKYELHN